MNSDGQLRLLVNYPGCPPFPVVVNGSKTVSELQKEVCASTASSGPSEPVSTPLPAAPPGKRRCCLQPGEWAFFRVPVGT